jgi:hypothetical protein
MDVEFVILIPMFATTILAIGLIIGIFKIWLGFEKMEEKIDHQTELMRALLGTLPVEQYAEVLRTAESIGSDRAQSD